MKLLANTAFGLEKITARELETLGLNPEPIDRGYVPFEGTLKDLYTTNLYLRTAEHIYVELAHQKVTDFDAFFDLIQSVPWEMYLNVDGFFHVYAKTHQSVLMAERSLQSLTKKAILKRLEEQTKVSVFLEKGVKYKILIDMYQDHVRVLLDTSGDALHQRKYRQKTGEAPLKETLAAAMILLSRYHGEAPLVDPFCGSGTLLIEAAMIALNIPPGLQRSFSFMDFKNADLALFQSVKKDAYQAIKQDDIPKLQGSDVDPKIIEMAKANAESAGVDGVIDFKVERFEMKKHPRDFHYLFTNPPYDERLMTMKEITPLYQAIGRYLRNGSNKDAFILTSVIGTEKLFDQRADKTRVLFNGPIKTRLYQYFAKQ